MVYCSPLGHATPLLVAKLAGNEHDEIDQPPDAEAAAGDEHEDSGRVLADVEAVGAEHTNEQAEQARREGAPVARHSAHRQRATSRVELLRSAVRAFARDRGDLHVARA